MNEWNRSELSAFIKGKTNGLVYFYTPMCGTCQVASKMLQVIEELVEVDMGKMNLNFYPDLAREYEIESVPCLLIIEAGEVKQTLYAFHSVPFLLEKIKQQIL
ncbi:thioredoxin family protein [Bacillus sp. X1(2014)]|uniref:thioredoxin family protein n=1 Tax=Bacillus sp. X1(2014) TaxID=1565991 RepID=UPI0011A28293|nr:thioredoxin family protein [Bacillus sp. X1(2014)]